MVVKQTKEIGELVRRRRKETGLTQRRTSGLAGVGVRFLGELERGKSTVELGRVLHVLDILGLEIHIQPKGLQR